MVGMHCSVGTLLWAVVVCALIYRFIQWRLSRRNLYALANKIPSAAPMLPLIGHGHYLYGNQDVVFKNIQMLCSGPSPNKVWLGPRLVFIITKPQDYEICFKCLEKEELYHIMAVLLKESLVTAPVSVWKRTKKTIMPGFSHKMLEGFTPVFVKQTNILIEKFKSIEGRTFNASDYLGKCTLAINCGTTMGLDLNIQTTDSKYHYNLERTMDLISGRVFNVFMHPMAIYRLTGHYRELSKLKRYFDNYTREVINKKREIRANKNKDFEGDGLYSHKDLLELLMDAAEADDAFFTEERIVNEVFTFLGAGSHSSSAVVGFALLMLGMNKDKQAKVYEEVSTILGQKDMTYKDLQQLAYTEMVIKETMRLFPVIALIGRKADHDIKLENCTLPAGSGMVFGIYSTHRNPEYFPDPLKFKPERFLPEEVEKRHPYAYSPFANGPRKCPGGNFGILTTKAVLATIIQNFEIDTDLKDVESVKLVQSVTLKSVYGYPIRIKSR